MDHTDQYHNNSLDSRYANYQVPREGYLYVLINYASVAHWYK